MDAAAPAERRRARTRQGGFLLALEEVGEPERAEAMLRQVADRRSASLGSNHPDTLAARAELAAVLSRKGDEASAAEALALRREVANLSETCLGKDHVDTLSAKAALAGAILRSCGPDANPADIKAARLEAEELHQQAAMRFSLANPMLPPQSSPPMSPMSPGVAGGGYSNTVSPPTRGGKLAVLIKD